ncbi:MAG TPA: hypothetical protein VHA55_03745 [Pseudorhodoplanes sp.]|jgi:hypothetical protein|nr:hypothetical protein [Pseudorhodoplanes sp.]
MRRAFIAGQLESALQKNLEAPKLRLLALEGERPAIDETREPWISIKYGPASPDEWFGVVPVVARFERAPGRAAERLELIVKINPRDGLARTLIPWIVTHREIALDRPFQDYRAAAEFDQTGSREYQVYALAPTLAPLGRVLPRCHGAAIDTASGEHALFLELVEAKRLDATGAQAGWPPDAIDAALRALAGWQSVLWNADRARFPWAGPRPSTADMTADAPLWHALVDDGRTRHPNIVTEAAWRRRHALIESLPSWHPIKDGLPGTLTHNDFNQRNVGFRPDVVVLDWELCQINTAHRDLVELLTFVLPPDTGRTEIDRHVEAHRAALVGAGLAIDRDAWFEGFRCELKVEAIDRIGFQLLFAAEFPLAYLARINANIERLLDLYR